MVSVRKRRRMALWYWDIDDWATRPLSIFRREVTREYIRKNMFASPCPDDYDDLAWIKWAKELVSSYNAPPSP